MWKRLALLAVLISVGTPALARPDSQELLKRLLEAHESGDVETMQRIVRDPRFDAWLLVEGLYERGHAEAATACAQATGWPKLVAYAKWRAEHPPLREVIEALNAVAEPDADRKAWLDKYQSLSEQEGQGIRFFRFLGRVGQSLHILERFDEAIPMYERAARGALDLGWHASAIRMYGFAGNASRTAKRYDDFERLTALRVELAADSGQHALHFQVLRQSSYEYKRMGRPRDARAYSSEAVKIAKSPSELRAALRDLAFVEIDLGETHAAVRSLTRLRELEVQADRPLNVAQCDLQLAIAEAMLGRFEHVLGRVASAIAYFEEHGDDKSRYLAHISAGKAHLIMRDSNRALHHVEEARKAIGGARAMQDLSLEASALSYLGRIEEAIPVFETTLRLKRSARPEHRVAAYINLANLLSFVKRPQEAESYLAEARKLLPEVNDQSVHAHAYAAESLVFAESGQWDRAIEAATKASGINGEMLNRELGAANEVMLARCWLEKGDPKRAMVHASNALKFVLERSAALPARLGAQYRSSLRSAFQYAVLAAVRANNEADVFQFAEQAAAVALRNRLGAQEVVLYAFSDELRERELELQEAETHAMAALRASLQTRDATTRRSSLAAVGKVREQLDRHRERVRAEQVAAGQVVDPEVDDLASTQARLGKDEALLMFVQGVHEIYAYRVTKTDAQTVRLGSRDEIQALLDGLVLEDPHAPAKDMVSELREKIAKPLGLPSVVKRLVIVPTGRVAHLPFSAIWPARSIRLASSATIDRLLKTRDPKPGKGVLAIGDPEGADGRRLPGAREEAKAIGDEVLLGADATEERLEKAIASRERWHAVHIACHALIDPNHPLRSALSLSPADKRDGLWTVSEILQASVSTDLVALGACSTGRGKTFDQEGALGFVQAFFVAGAKRVLVSLWDVDDKATSALLQQFHAEWKPGVSPARALATAQAKIREQPRWRHPAYWAAWQLWGPE